MTEPIYQVKERTWPFPHPLKRPWAMYRDGKQIGFYETEEAARAALPEDTAS